MLAAAGCCKSTVITGLVETREIGQATLNTSRVRLLRFRGHCDGDDRAADVSVLWSSLM